MLVKHCNLSEAVEGKTSVSPLEDTLGALAGVCGGGAVSPFLLGEGRFTPSFSRESVNRLLEASTAKTLQCRFSPCCRYAVASAMNSGACRKSSLQVVPL